MTSRTPTSSGARVAADLRPVVAGVVQAAGYDLEQVSVARAGRRSVVRVVVDADAGVSLDDVAEVSRAISAALDAGERTDAFDGEGGLGAYTLEVTSPGVDRPLTTPRHWRRAVGRVARTRIEDRPVQGRIVGADDAGVELDVDGTRRAVAYGELGPGTVQVEFTHPPAGKGPAGTGPARTTTKTKGARP